MLTISEEKLKRAAIRNDSVVNSFTLSNAYFILEISH